jgi:four helix bundle protein
VDAAELKKRTQCFGIEIIRFVQSLPGNDSTNIISRQLLRCGTSVGANYRAACRAKSNADFIAKLKIVEEECDESIYWIELLVNLPSSSFSDLESLRKEADEILRIIVASIRTARAHNPLNRKSSMDCRWLLLFLFDLAPNVPVIDFKLPFQLLALALIAEIAVAIHPTLPFDQQITDKHPPQVGNAGDSGFRTAYRGQKGECAHDQHKPLNLDGQKEIQIYDAVGIGQSISEKQTVDRAGCSDNNRPAVHCHQPGTNSRTDAGHEIIIAKTPRAPVSLQFIAEHVKRQHVEKNMKGAPMQKHVCHKLPVHQPLSDKYGNQPEMEVDIIAAEQMKDDLQEINAYIGNNERFDSPGCRSSKKIARKLHDPMLWETGDKFNRLGATKMLSIVCFFGASCCYLLFLVE